MIGPFTLYAMRAKFCTPHSILIDDHRFFTLEDQCTLTLLNNRARQVLRQ
jgi:hypothetical protein